MSVEQVNGGFVVQAGQFQLGRDGYWARGKSNALPFRTFAEAEVAALAERDRDPYYPH